MEKKAKNAGSHPRALEGVDYTGGRKTSGLVKIFDYSLFRGEGGDLWRKKTKGDKRRKGTPL